MLYAYSGQYVKKKSQMSTDRFEKSLPAPPSSCDGEPVPDLAIAVAVLTLLLPGFPNGDRTAVPACGSIGEVLAVEDPDRG